MPAFDQRTVRVKNLAALLRAFAHADKTLQRELKDRLRRVAEPVRSQAEQLAAARIRNIGPRWSLMRVGVTRSLVYVAPKERGRKNQAQRLRPNLAGLLMGRAMSPALDANEGRAEREIGALLDEVGRNWERTH